VDEAAAILKGINESIRSGGPVPSGTNIGVVEVGPHRLKTVTDVSSSTMIRDGNAIVSFGHRTLTVDFEKGQIVLDREEPATLPAGTKEVEIRFRGGKLSATADGADVPIPGAPR
jgi:hypothetical protein